MSGSFFYNFMMGGMGASFSKTVSCPVDTVKLLEQVNGERDYVKILEENDVEIFWRGNMANMFRYFPTQMITLVTIDFYRSIFCRFNIRTEPGKFFMGALLAETAEKATGLAVVYPMDFTRTRLAVDVGLGGKREFEGHLDCLAKCIAKDGVAEIYQGFGISVFGIFAYKFTNFVTFQVGKMLFFKNYKKSSELSKFVFKHLVLIFAGVVSYPFDTIRRRLMINVGKVGVDKLYDGVFDCVQKILDQEGIMGFFKGCFNNILRVALSYCALDFISFFVAALEKDQNKPKPNKNNKKFDETKVVTQERRT